MIKNKSAFLGIGCFYFAISLCLGMIWPCYTCAQIDTAKAKQLDEVQIKAKRLNQLLSSPTPVQLLGGDDLKRINSLSVADAVRYFSGVQLKDYGGVGGLKTINVRSMGSNHTAVFYDGIQLGNAQNGQVDLGRYALSNIEEIALYSGQKSELLQPAKSFAAASALYLSTPTPRFKEGQIRYFTVGVKTGSFGLIDPMFSYTQKLTARLSFNVNAELLNANGKYKYRYTNGVYDTTVVRQNSDVFSKRIAAGVFAQLPDSSSLQLKIYHYNSERGVPGAIVSNKFDFDQRQWDDDLFVQTTYQNRNSKRYQVLVNAKYAYDFTRYLDPAIQSLAGALDNRYTQQEAYLSIANQYAVNSYWTLSLAADYSYQQLNANLKYFAYPIRNTGLLAFASNLKWKRFSLQGNVLATFVNESVQYYASAGNKAEYTPTILSAWQPFENPAFRLRSFYKSIFRMPTFNDLYYTFVGNSNLRPEYTAQYNIGLTFEKDYKTSKLTHLSFQTDVYYNEVRDKIVAVPTVNLFRWTMLNLDKVAIKGVETNLHTSWQFGELFLKSKMGYTYERALDVTKTGFTYRQQIPYIPVHSGSLTLGADWKGVGINYSFIYTGERYSQKANIPVNYIPSWYTHDVAIHKGFTGGKRSYQLSAEVNNLLNQYYDVVLNYPMPGRNFRLGLSINFN